MDLEIVRSGELASNDLVALRGFLTDAFEGRYDDGNWANALGGTHVIMRDRGSLVAHASIVPRMLYFSTRAEVWHDTAAREVGYVESVAVEHQLRGRGSGTHVLNIVNRFISKRFGFGALGTSSHAFYERTGWRRWRGPTYVYKSGALHRTPGGEQWLMVLAPAETVVTGAIACEWREGDLW